MMFRPACLALQVLLPSSDQISCFRAVGNLPRRGGRLGGAPEEPKMSLCQHSDPRGNNRRGEREEKTLLPFRLGPQSVPVGRGGSGG